MSKRTIFRLKNGFISKNPRPDFYLIWNIRLKYFFRHQNQNRGPYISTPRSTKLSQSPLEKPIYSVRYLEYSHFVTVPAYLPVTFLYILFAYKFTC